MAEYRRSESADRRYKALIIDNAPVKINICKSILETRRIYSDKTDDEFVQWYSRRYRVKPETIRGVLGKATEISEE